MAFEGGKDQGGAKERIPFIGVPEDEQASLRTREIQLWPDEKLDIPTDVGRQMGILFRQSTAAYSEALTKYYTDSKKPGGEAAKQIFEDLYFAARYWNLDVSFGPEGIKVSSGEDEYQRHENIFGRELIDLEATATRIQIEERDGRFYANVGVSLVSIEGVDQIKAKEGGNPKRLEQAIKTVRKTIQEFGSGTTDTPAIFSIPLQGAGYVKGEIVDQNKAREMVRELRLNDRLRKIKEARMFAGGYSSDMFIQYDGVGAQARADSPDGVLIFVGVGGAQETHIKSGKTETIAGKAGEMTQEQMSYQIENFINLAGLGYFEELTIEGHSMSGKAVLLLAERYAREVEGIDIVAYREARKTRIRKEMELELARTQSSETRLGSTQYSMLNNEVEIGRCLDQLVDTIEPEETPEQPQPQKIEGIRERIRQSALASEGKLAVVLNELISAGHLRPETKGTLARPFDVGDEVVLNELKRVTSLLHRLVKDRDRLRDQLSDINQEVSASEKEIRDRYEHEMAMVDQITKDQLWKKIFWDVDTPATTKESVADLITGFGFLLHLAGNFPLFGFLNDTKNVIGKKWAERDSVTPVEVLHEHARNVTDSKIVSTLRQLLGMTKSKDLTAEQVAWINKVPYMVIKLGAADVIVFTQKVEKNAIATGLRQPLVYYPSSHFPMAMPGYQESASAWHEMRRAVRNPAEWWKILEDIRLAQAFPKEEESKRIHDEIYVEAPHSYPAIGGLRHQPGFAEVDQFDQARLMQYFSGRMGKYRELLDRGLVKIGEKDIRKWFEDRYSPNVARAAVGAIMASPGAIGFAV